MRPHGSPEDLARRRVRAMALLEEGYRPLEVARQLGVDRRSVRRWRAAHRAQGPQGIAARPAPGRPSKLDAAAKRQLEDVLLKGARAAGFPTDLWTCPRVAQAIRTRFRVRYHPAHVWRLLRSLGWSAQRPSRRAAERDEAAIRRWVREDWPRIKKGPRN